MPSKLKAGGTFAYILECDQKDARENVFHLRILSCEEYDRLSELRDEFFRNQDGQSTIDAMLELAVVSWDVPLSNGKPLKSFLNSRECFELVAAAISGTMLTEEERKKQESLHLSEAESCVTDATAISAATR